MKREKTRQKIKTDRQVNTLKQTERNEEKDNKGEDE